MSSWYYEEQDKGLKIGLEYTEHLVDSKSEFQKVDVYKTTQYGNLLTLDGLVMTTGKDEFFYHEMLAHPALFTHSNPEKVLVIGGGDGGTLREVIKHNDVKEGHLCEIDKMVCDVSLKYFPKISSSLNHEKTQVFYQDGFKFLDEHKANYQVIFTDSTDPIGEAAKLFEEPFIKKVYDALTDDGIAVMQCENPFFQLNIMKDMYQKFKGFFPHVSFYFAPIPTYPSGYWAFILGSRKYEPLKDFKETKWKERNFKTKYYNKEVHFGAFALPQYVKEGLGLED